MNGVGLRKAAYVLAQLGDEDQRWLLAQLPDQVRGQLVYLIVEAKQLGFASEDLWEDGIENIHGLVEQLDKKDKLEAPDVKAEEPTSTHNEPNYIAKVNAMDSSEVVETLNKLPSIVVRVFLNARDWPWKSAVESRLKLGCFFQKDNTSQSRSRVANSVARKVVEKVCANLLITGDFEHKERGTPPTRNIFGIRRKS